MGLAVTKQEAFWEACGFGNKERVKKLIQEGIDVNWVSYTHNSCAIHVASQGKAEIVQMLLDAGCNVNAKDDRGNLALHHAAMKGHAGIAKMLIDAGSEIDAQDKNGWTSLTAAAYFCQPSVVELLVNHNCDVNLQNKDMRTALHETCRSQSNDEEGLLKIAKILIDHKADVNSKSCDLGEADFTPLIFTAYHGHPLVAQALIDATCDINAQESNSWTALHWACDRNHIDVVRVLVEAGAASCITGRRGELAIDRTRNIEIHRLLSEAVDTDKDNNVRSPTSVQDRVLMNINESIASKAAENRALVEAQRSVSSSSLSSSGSVDNSDSDDETEDFGEVNQSDRVLDVTKQAEVLDEIQLTDQSLCVTKETESLDEVHKTDPSLDVDVTKKTEDLNEINKKDRTVDVTKETGEVDQVNRDVDRSLNVSKEIELLVSATQEKLLSEN